MKLSIKDRLSLHNLFPQQGTLSTQIMVKELTEKTKIPTEEANKVGLKQQGASLIWNKKAKDKDIALTKAELELLKAGVERLDKQGKITQNLLGLCLKIKNEKSTS